MATITTSMVLLRWPLLSAVLMFLASTLNIQFRKSDYAGLAVISTLLGLGAACWGWVKPAGLQRVCLASPCWISPPSGKILKW